MRNLIGVAILILGAVLAPRAGAGLLLFDIDADPDAWSAAVSGLGAATAYDFGLDADYGIDAFDQPLDAAGGGPVSPGVLAGGVAINAIDLGGDGTDQLAAVGPSAGLGNAENAVVANFLVDAFSIGFGDPVAAFAFNAVSLLGFSDVVDITARDGQGGEVLFRDVFIGGAAGRNLGILGTDGMLLGGLALFDPGDGAEGVQGGGTIYRQRSPVSVYPTPALVGLALTLAGLVIRRRRLAATA